MRTPDISPSTVLGEIRACLLAEVASRPAPEPVTLRRDIAVLLAVSLGEQIDRVDALAQAAESATHLERELRIAFAEIRRLETHLIARDIEALDRRPLAPASVCPSRDKAAAERANRRAIEALRVATAEIDRGRACVVDLGEMLAKRRRALAPTDGGAA